MYLLLSACNTKPKSNHQGEIINIDIDTKDVDMLNIKIKKLIKLEFSDSSIIGRTNTVRYYKDYFYILDHTSVKALFLFDKQGKYIKKTIIGRGPGEISEPRAFDIDEHNNKIIIHDQRRRDLVSFDLDLNYLGSQRHDIYICNFAKIDDDKFLVRANAFRGINISRKDKEKDTYAIFSDNFSSMKILNIKIGAQTFLRTMGSPINIFNDEIIFVSPHNYNIYQLKEGNTLVKYTIDLGKYTFSQEELATLTSMEMIQMERKGERIGRFNSVINSDNFLVFSLGLYPYKTFFHSYNNGTTYRLDDCIQNNLLPPCGVWGAIEKNTFYATVKPQHLKEFVEKSKMYPDIEISEMDNPYILIFEISE